MTDQQKPKTIKFTAKQFRQWIADNVDDNATITCVVAEDMGGYAEGKRVSEKYFTPEIGDVENYRDHETGKYMRDFVIGTYE